MSYVEPSARPNVDITYADAYFATRLYSDVWTAASDADKTKAVAQASMLVASAFEFNEDAYAVDEYGAVVWNERALAAVCEEALWLLQRDPTQLPDALTYGVSSASVASLSVVFDATLVAPLICPAARALVGNLGTFLDPSSGFASTPLAF